jgi:hypothetical protein
MLPLTAQLGSKMGTVIFDHLTLRKPELNGLAWHICIKISTTKESGSVLILIKAFIHSDGIKYDI